MKVDKVKSSPPGSSHMFLSFFFFSICYTCFFRHLKEKKRTWSWTYTCGTLCFFEGGGGELKGMVIQERGPKGRETWTEPGIDCKVQEKRSGQRE